MTVDVEIGGRVVRVELNRTDSGWAATLNGRTRLVRTARIGEWSSLLVADDVGGATADGAWTSHEISIEDRGNGSLLVHVDGTAVPLLAIDPRRSFGRGPADRSHTGGPTTITAPMPGRVVKVLVKPGDQVSARQGLVVVEAMKMENELRAPVDARVVDVPAVEGASVEANTVLVVLE